MQMDGAQEYVVSSHLYVLRGNRILTMIDLGAHKGRPFLISTSV